MCDILQFPSRNKGRVRKSQGWFAAGELTLANPELDGVPDNVARLVVIQADDNPVPDGELALLIAATVFHYLPDEAKTRMLGTLGSIASSNPRAVAALRVLDPTNHRSN